MNDVAKSNSTMFAWSLHLAGAAIIALTLGGFYAFVYQPLQNRHNAQAERSEQLNVLLINTGETGSEYRQLRTHLASMKKSAAQIQEKLDNASSEEKRIEDINKIAADVDLEVLDFQIGLTESLATHQQTEVEFRCLGSYASICKFLHQTEQLTSITKLSKFTLETTKKSGVYPLEITFVLYSGALSNDTKERQEVL